MSGHVKKLLEDLKKKLDRLCWMHNEPAWYLAEYFAELRRKVDLDAERLLSEIQAIKSDIEKASEVNRIRMDFIRILEELEKITGHQLKPGTDSSKVYASLEQRINEFKDSVSSLDDLEDSYVQLAREIIDETNQLEKHIIGEQTIIYWPPKEKDRLGSLVYFGDVFLSQQQIDHLMSRVLKDENIEHALVSVGFQSFRSLIDHVNKYLQDELSKSKLVVKSLASDGFKSLRHLLAGASKFVYIGKTKKEYPDFLAEGSSVAKEFVSYQFNGTVNKLCSQGEVDLDTSANLFDVYSSPDCELEITNFQLQSLHANLLPSPADRLSSLVFRGVHLETFDPNVLAKCTNLTRLSLQVTFSKQFKFELDFLRELRKLETLELTLPDLPSDFSELNELAQLSSLKLESCSIVFAEPFPKLSREALKQIFSSLPQLSRFELSYFDIEAIDLEMLSQFKLLDILDLSRNRIRHIDTKAFAILGSENFTLNIGNSKLTDWSWNAYGSKSLITILNLMNVGIHSLKNDHFARLTNLSELCLSNNSIVELPPGVFARMTCLKKLDLSNNNIRQVKVGSFDKLYQLQELFMSGNPIETIEANAFAPLVSLTRLILVGCKLKSIDSEMFVGLSSLRNLWLDNNLIESIEVVAEDGRRINVAKAVLSKEEKELIAKRLFKDLSKLSQLKLNENKLEKLHLDCFINLTGLWELHVVSNRINELRCDTRTRECFCRYACCHPETSTLLPTLRTFDLSHNRLEDINLNYLPRNLKNFYLTGNMLTKKDGAEFEREFKEKFCYQLRKQASSSQTKIIKLTHEAIISTIESNWIDFGLFSALDLSENLIESLDDSSLFDVYAHFKSINLSNNRLRHIDRGIFWSLQELETIDLSKNELTSVDHGLFRGLGSLSKLNLSSNNISFINLARLFRICPRLKDLNLADNQLDERSTAEPIDAGTSSSLEELQLGGNRLEKMDFVRHMTRLSRLDLRVNRIESVVSDGYNLLGGLTALKHLDLSANRIRSLTYEMLAHFGGKLEHLDLSGNPLDNFEADSFKLAQTI